MFFADKNVCNGTLAHKIKLGSTSSIFMLGQLIHIACGLKIKFKTRGNTSWHGIKKDATEINGFVSNCKVCGKVVGLYPRVVINGKLNGVLSTRTTNRSK